MRNYIQRLLISRDRQGRTSEQIFPFFSVGEAMIVTRSEWVRYSTPGAEGAEYIAVCVPAFSLQTVHRDAQ